MNLILVTDNHFWRGRLGSERRIGALYEHLVTAGWRVRILFIGHLYPNDEVALSTIHPTPALFGPAGIASATDQSGFVQAERLLRRVKHFIRTGARLLRALWRSLATARSVDELLFNLETLSIRAREPTLADYRSERHIALMSDLCSIERPDCVIVEYARLSYILDGVPRELPAPVTIVDTQDVMHERHARFLANREVHEIDMTAKEEAKVLGRFDFVLAINATDAVRFARLLSPSRILVVGHPQEVWRLPIRKADYVRLGFFASAMAPNKSAIEGFLRSEWLKLRNEFGSHVSLEVYGQVCEHFSQAHVAQGVSLHGYVDDLKSAYGEIDIVINPVTFGGGLKIKNVEALAFGKPLVTTSIGAEGLETGVGTAFIVADDPADFGKTISMLIRNPHCRERLSEAAFSFAADRFSQRAVYSDLDRLLARASPRNPGGASARIRSQGERAEQ